MLKQIRIRSLKSKIIAVFIGFASVILLLQIGVFQRWIGTMILEKSDAYFQETVHQIGKRMDLQLKQFHTMASGVSHNQVVINYLADLNSHALNYQIAKYKISNEVLRVTTLDWIDNMILYPVGSPPINLYYTRPVFDIEPEILTLLNQRPRTDADSFIWMDARQTPFQTSVLLPIDEQARLGVLKISLNASFFGEMLDEVKLGHDGAVYIVQGDTIVYAKQRELIGTSLSGLSPDRSTRVGYQLNETGWTLVGIVPQAELLDQINQFNRIFVLMVIVILAAIMAFAIAAAQLVLRPLKKIIKGMERVQEGDLQVVLEPDRLDEFGKINAHFNGMVERVQSLIRTIYRQQRHQRHAEIIGLLSKLNPHFLYNALDMIYWKAVMKGEEEIGDTIVALSDILRYSISHKHEFVPIREDMRQLESYLKIQMLRFVDKLQYTIDIQQEIMEVSIPKLLIQPLVENAIKYAFQDMKHGGHITIRGYADQYDIYLEVSDNGIGMTEEQVQKLISSCELQGEETGIGIRLVHQRAALFYGEGYGVSIESAVGAGTTVKVRISAHAEQRHEMM